MDHPPWCRRTARAASRNYGHETLVSGPQRRLAFLCRTERWALQRVEAWQRSENARWSALPFSRWADQDPEPGVDAAAGGPSLTILPGTDGTGSTRHRRWRPRPARSGATTRRAGVRVGYRRARQGPRTSEPDRGWVWHPADLPKGYHTVPRGHACQAPRAVGGRCPRGAPRGWDTPGRRDATRLPACRSSVVTRHRKDRYIPLQARG
jgi:hypothetical protein